MCAERLGNTALNQLVLPFWGREAMNSKQSRRGALWWLHTTIAVPLPSKWKCFIQRIIILKYSLESWTYNFQKLLEPPGCDPADHCLLFNVLYIHQVLGQGYFKPPFPESTLVVINSLIHDQQKSIALCNLSKKPAFHTMSSSEGINTLISSNSALARNTTWTSSLFERDLCSGGEAQRIESWSHNAAESKM